MKKCSTLLLIAFLCLNISVYAEEAPPSVYVNGEQISFEENYPTIIDGRTMIPLREIFKVFSFLVSYHEDTQTIRLQNETLNVFFRIGDKRFFIENEFGITYRDLDVPPLLQGWRTYIPLRAVAEVLGAKVDWEEKTTSVLITL